MPYKGPPVICRFCGRSFTRPTSLARHLEQGRCANRKAAGIVQAEAFKPGKATKLVSAKPETRTVAAIAQGSLPTVRPNGLPNWPTVRTQEAVLIHRPEGNEEVLLWSQYYALKAIAVRLDAGCGTERDRMVFERGLREYNTNFSRIRTARTGRRDGNR